MDNLILLRRRLISVVDGTYDPGYPYLPETVGFYSYQGSSVQNYVTATVLLPPINISPGENNITYYLKADTINGTVSAPKGIAYRLFQGDGSTSAGYQEIQTVNEEKTRLAQYGGSSLITDFPVYVLGMEESYAYATQTGRILFAGKKSPYFGKRYITD